MNNNFAMNNNFMSYGLKSSFFIWLPFFPLFIRHLLPFFTPTQFHPSLIPPPFIAPTDTHILLHMSHPFLHTSTPHPSHLHPISSPHTHTLSSHPHTPHIPPHHITPHHPTPYHHLHSHTLQTHTHVKVTIFTSKLLSTRQSYYLLPTHTHLHTYTLSWPFCPSVYIGQTEHCLVDLFAVAAAVTLLSHQYFIFAPSS